jgi:hypothetical protein
MNWEMITIVTLVCLIYAIGLYYLIKLQAKEDKKRTFVKKVGEGKKLLLRGYSWIYVENDSKIYSGVLVSYFDKDDGLEYQVALRMDYFNNNYISLEDKEKEEKHDNRG